MAKIDIGIVSFNNPEVTLTNINAIVVQNKLNISYNNIFVIDNSNIDINIILEHGWINEFIKKDYQDITYIDNTKNSIFNRIMPSIDRNEKYGFSLYEQSIKYLIEHSVADYLYIFDNNCIANGQLNYNPDNIWTNFNNNVYVINLNIIRQYNIRFNNFAELKDRLLYFSFLKYEDIISDSVAALPDDSAKLNNIIFMKSLNYRTYFIKKWFAEKYNIKVEYADIWDN